MASPISIFDVQLKFDVPEFMKSCSWYKNTYSAACLNGLNSLNAVEPVYNDID
jgi:hypothetical protein